MDWQVDGADRESGEDKAFLITADTEGEARAIGEAQNIYVSTVVPYVDPNYVPPAPASEDEPEPADVAPASPPRQTKRRTPPPPTASSYVAQQQQLAYARPGASAAANTFADVPGAARRLRAADWVLSIFGWIYVALGVVLGLLILITTIRLGIGFDAVPLLTTLILPLALIAGGVLLLGAGAALRMLASIGVASAEVARRKQ